MIMHKAFFTDEEMSEIAEFCNSSCIGLKAFMPLCAYGTGYGFAEFWVQLRSNEPSEDMSSVSAFISKFYGDAVVFALPSADFDELELFLQTVGFAGLVSNVPLFNMPVGGHIMRLEKGALCSAIPSFEETLVIENGSLKDFYGLLSKNYPDNVFSQYDDWFVDLSHRVRHGVTETAVLTCGGENVATASALCITDKAVLLGALSVNPEKRGKHFAHTLLKHFCNKFGDRTVYVMCKPDKVLLYEKAAFENADVFYRK